MQTYPNNMHAPRQKVLLWLWLFLPGVSVWSQAADVSKASFESVPVRALSFTDNDQKIVAVYKSGAVWEWSLSDSRSNRIVQIDITPAMVGKTFIKNVGHEGEPVIVKPEVNSAELSVDGKVIACVVNHFREIWFRRQKDVPPEVYLRGGRVWPSALLLSRSGRYLATTAKDTSVEVWDTLDRKIIATGQGLYPVAFSPDDTSLLMARMGLYQGEMGAWQFTTKRRTDLYPTNGVVVSRALWPIADMLLITSTNQEIFICNSIDGAVRGRVRSAFEYVGGLAATSRGDVIACAEATGGRSGRVEFWDVKQQKLLHTAVATNIGISTMAFSGDGKTLAIGGFGGEIQLVEVESTSLDIK